MKNAPAVSTISELLDARLADLTAAGKRRARDTPYFHKALKEHFGYLKPDTITSAHVNAFKDKRKEVPAALREEIFELKNILLMAERQGLINRALYIEVPAKSPPREKFLTREQAQTLLDAAGPTHLKTYLLIAMRTGARKGAILGLTWDRVDLQRARLDFTDPELAETKKRRTVVPIGANLVSFLRAAKLAAETDHVVEYKGAPIKDVKKSFHEAAEAAMVPWATPHTLKHSVISWLAEDGHTVDKISDMTATHPNTVRRIYRKFNPDYLQDMASSLDEGMSIANPFVKPVK